MKTSLNVPDAPQAVGPYSHAQVVRLHGGNVSAAIGDAAELLRIEENRQAFEAKLEEELGPLDHEVARAILMETMGRLPPLRRKKKVA